ncbi:hypothetical protein ACS0TY_007890 [Phlomoides rotata]
MYLIFNNSGNYLNSIKYSGLLIHHLILKIVVSIMLIRNIDPKSGLCNDTRLIVTKLENHVIEAYILFKKKKCGRKCGRKCVNMHRCIPSISLEQVSISAFIEACWSWFESIDIMIRASGILVITRSYSADSCPMVTTTPNPQSFNATSTEKTVSYNENFIHILFDLAEANPQMPIMTLMVSDVTTPVKFRRRQFPVLLCFAMTINKSQGQSLSTVGVYLPKSIFTRGQLYVVASKVKSKDGLKFLCLDSNEISCGHTTNVV